MKIDGKKICDLRKLKGLSQDKLADLANVNLRTVQRIERGDCDPHGNTLNSICEVLEIGIDEIMIQDNLISSNHVFGYKIASKWKRFIANLLEFIILFTVIWVPVILYNVVVNGSDLRNFDAIGIEYITVFSLFVGAFFYPLFSGNLGHMMFQLKVISAVTGEDYDKASDGAIREFLKYIMSYVFIPLIWILWDEKNQNLYDKFTKTYVVEK